MIFFIQEEEKMQNNSALILGVVVFLVASIAAGSGIGRQPSAENQKNCSYTILIETTCRKDASTSDQISLRFGDSKSKEILVKHLSTWHTNHTRRLERRNVKEEEEEEADDDVDDIPRRLFQPCGIDQFQFTANCVESPICYLYLKQRGKDKWRPGSVQVLLLPEISHLSSKTFHFRRFLPLHVWHGSDMCDTEVTPFGIKHARKIFPGKASSHILE